MTPPPPRTAAVVGAGIGGLAAAVALGRAGWSVTVHERATAPDAPGAGLVLWPNAVHALDVLGLGDAVRGRAAVLAGSALRRADGRWHAPIPALLDALDPDAVLRHDVHALRHVPAPLHRGTAVLLGDAAHAMEPNLGQGACLALEDAVVLTHLLADDVPVEQALARYSAARRPRAVTLSRLSARLGRVTQGGGRVRAAVRDAAVRLTPAPVVLRGSDRAAGWRPPPPS